MKTIIERLAAVEAELRDLSTLMRAETDDVTIDNCVQIHSALSGVYSAAIYAESSLEVRHRRMMAQKQPDGRTLGQVIEGRIQALYHRHTPDCYDHAGTENTPVCGIKEGWPDAATLADIDNTP